LTGYLSMNMSYARLRWLYLRGPFLWGGLGASVFGLLMLLLGFLVWQTEQGFQERAIRVVAKVTGKENGMEMVGKKYEMVYRLNCTFPKVGGGSSKGKLRVSGHDWQQAKTGDEVAVEFDSTNPGTLRRAGTDAHADWGLLILGGIGGVFAVIGITLAVIAFVDSGRRARLVRCGIPTLGVVGELAGNDSALKVTGTYRLTYSFTGPNGTTFEGRGPAQSKSLATRWDPGETILVLYDARNPKRSEADVFEARNEELAKLQEQAELQG
jgi:hypothetical protein